ncbi:MAG: selenium metabolism-associated LysR family transcriptional regulator [Acidobacteriota bacterium]
MNQMRLDLSLVEVFCYVYEHGSFSKAAESLRLTQPTISGHIKNLEEYIGVTLFDRLPRRIVPTSAGKLLYGYGRSILNEKAAAVQSLSKLLNRMEGSLVICGSTIPGEYLLPKWIASFHSVFPGVDVELLISDSNSACRDVLSGKAEIGCVGAKIESIGLEFHHFATDELALVVPNNEEWSDIQTIKLESLSQMHFLAREVGSGSRLAFEKQIGRSLDEFNLVGRFGSTSAIKEAIKSGLGVSVLSLLSVKSEIASGLLRTVNIEGLDTIRREFFAVINKRLTLSPIAEAFLNTLGIVRAADNGNGYGDGASHPRRSCSVGM